MKAKIHPKWYPEAKVSCACGNKFTVGSTIPEIAVEVCSKCHPFYTGQMKYVDTAGRVEAFIEKRKKAKDKVVKKSEKRKLKREKRIREELAKPESLEDIRKQIKKSKKSSSKKEDEPKSTKTKPANKSKKKTSNKSS
ncbi:50S ribosomal protein L31 [Candidatus Woesebacteria bacterium]|nr:50S ribosomal protein L31 [Candidatus Woesebacteria bacterium]